MEHANFPGMQALVRLTFLLTATVSALASSSSSTNTPPPLSAADSQPTPQPPASQPMDPSLALGLWNSNFGAVKVEADSARGPAQLMGIWLYDREGQEIIGFFSGAANGNVLRFNWEEPSTGAPLRGAGYLVFDPGGASFSGRWWTDNRDRGGDWNGWRGQPTPAPAAAPDPEGAAPDEDAAYAPAAGGAPLSPTTL